MRQFLVLAVCATSAIAGSPVLAEEAFIGRWATTAQTCGTRGGDSPANSALVATDTSLWWYDGYCRIGKMYKAKAVYVQAHCDGKDVSVMLDAMGDRLKVSWAGGKAEELQRCK